MLKSDLIFLNYIIALIAGWWLMSLTWSGNVYVYVGEERSPAAIKHLRDFYPMDGRVLRESLETQMFDNVNFMNRESEIGIRLAHFLLLDSKGRRQFACQSENRPGLYDRVEISFVGVGVSDDGKIPKMTVD